MANSSATPFIEQMSGLGEIDKTHGRVYLLNGDLFYSPNSSREIVVPKALEEGRNIFSPPRQPDGRLNYWGLDIQSYLTPQWWSLPFGWVAFLEYGLLDSEKTLLRPLKYSKAEAHPDKCHFSLASFDQQQWLRFEYQLQKTHIILHSHYAYPSLLPHPPHVFGYLASHSNLHLLQTALDKSREWFCLWLALTSYSIACSETHEERYRPYAALVRMHWLDLLLAEGKQYNIDQNWVDQLAASSVASFSSTTTRVGVFLNLAEHAALQPDLSWFCKYSVPVWYPWTPFLSNHPRYSRYAPPSHQLQLATTFLTATPNSQLTTPPCHSPEICNLSSNVSTTLDSSPQFLNIKPFITRTQTYNPNTTAMDKFFELRQERNLRLIANETERSQQIRLSRKKQPPRVSTRVFVWNENVAGEYECEEVDAKRREDFLEDYDDDQCRYNAVHNEWHLCILWGAQSAGDERCNNESVKEYEGNMSDLPPLPESVTLSSTLANDTWSPQTLQDLAVSSLSHSSLSEGNVTLVDRLEGEILSVLGLYCGYTPSTPLDTSCHPLEGENQRRSFCLSIGVPWPQAEDHQEVFQRPTICAGIDFLQRLARGDGHVSSDEWDLLSNNRCSIIHTQRFKQFRVVQSSQAQTLYLLNLGRSQAAKWFLALKHAADVATVCRLDQRLNEYDLVEFLLTNGIPFHTLQPSETIPQVASVSRPNLNLPLRKHGYKFTSEDYIAYRERCTSLLQHPRGRAALMHGSEMWRLAMNYVPWESVIQGPLGCSNDVDGTITVQDPKTGLNLVDDSLTQEEQNALCGTYVVFTGKGEQQALASWYMPPVLREKAAENLGRWTGISEELFSFLDNTHRLSNTQVQHEPSACRQPRSRKQWQLLIRGTLLARAARIKIASAVEKWLA